MAYRAVLSDEAWARIEDLCPGKPGDNGRTAKDNRLFVEAVIWQMRTGTQRRDLPEESGKWNSVFVRFRRWAQKGNFTKIFNILSGDPDLEWAFVDGTVVKAHPKASGDQKWGSGTQSLAHAPEEG